MQESNHLQLGLTNYHQAWEIQRSLAEACAMNSIADTLITLEHPHTYTLGRSAHPEHLLLNSEECSARGIEVIEVDRGGDITYHGPGQLVAYPIRYLGQADASGRLVAADYVGYVRRLEDVIIQTIAEFDVTGRREEGLTGVWVDTRFGPAKIAAIGVRVNAKGISTHGTALNVTTNLSYFDGIIPCGIRNKSVISLWTLLRDSTPSMHEMLRSFTQAYSKVFECALTSTTIEMLISDTQTTE